MKTKLTWILVLAFALAPAVAVAAPLKDSQIRSVVNSHLSDLRSCMKEHGASTGKLMVEFTIAPDGKVSDSKVKHHSSNAKLDGCIAKAFRDWSFPRPQGGVAMLEDYPFAFAPPKAPPPHGTLDQAEIVKTVKSKQSEVDACYDAASQGKPLVGAVHIGFVISPTGQVGDAKILSTDTKSPKLDECLLQHLKAWQFPKPKGGEVDVNYPFAWGHKR